MVVADLGTIDGIDDLVKVVVVVAHMGTIDGIDDLVVRDTGAGEATNEVDGSCANIEDVSVRECSCGIEDINVLGTVQDNDVKLGIVQDNGVELGTVQDNDVELGTVWDNDVKLGIVQDNGVELGAVWDNDVELGIVQDNEFGVVLSNEESLRAGNDWSSNEACEHGQDETDVTAIEDDCKMERLAR